MPYIFYDTETTGIETYYDQILQFAAIATDDDLNEIARINLRCRRLPWIVPSPGALLVTKVSPAVIEGENRSHYDMIGEVETWLRAQGPATYLGYNSVRFDEVLLRQALYQTLRPIYLTNTDGNVRGDLMVTAQAVATYAPDAIEIPRDNRGRHVFRLGDVARANKIDLSEEKAHEALTDVRATVDLAKLLRDRAPEIWNQMILNTRKAHLERFLDENPVFFSTNFFFGAPYTFAMATAGINNTNNSEYATFDLSHDPREFLDLDVDRLLDVLNLSPKVIRTTRINSQPIIMPYERRPNEVRGGELPYETYIERARLIQGNAVFQRNVGEAMVRRYEGIEPSPYVEGRIYEGFPSPQDATLMKSFHQTPWENRPAICDQIQDARFAELGRRLIYAEHEEVLSEPVRNEVADWMRQRLSSAKDVPWTTVEKALQQARDLRRSQPEQAETIDEIIAFLTELGERAAGA